MVRRDSDIACSLCGPLPTDGAISPGLFARYQLTCEEFTRRSPEILNNTRLVFRLNGQYETATTALTKMLSLLLFKKPIGEDEVAVPQKDAAAFSAETLTAESLLRPTTPASGTPTPSSSASLSPASVSTSINALATQTLTQSLTLTQASSAVVTSSASSNSSPAPKKSWFSWRRKESKPAAEASKKQTAECKSPKEQQQSEPSTKTRSAKAAKAAEILSQESNLDDLESALSDTEIEQRNSTDRKRRMGTAMLQSGGVASAQLAGDLSVSASASQAGAGAGASTAGASACASGVLELTKCKSEEQVNVSHLMDAEQLLGAALPHPPGERVRFSLPAGSGSSERLRVQPKCQKAPSKKHLSSRQLAQLNLMTGENHISYSVTTQFQGAYVFSIRICSRNL